MKIQLYANSRKGFFRSNNEDCYFAGKSVLRDRELELVTEPEGTFAMGVLDGLGGHNAGEIASELTATLFLEKLETLPQNLTEQELQKYLEKFIKEIHKFIILEGKKDPEKKGMATTLTSVVIYGGVPYSVHAGDCRIYRYRNNYLVQLTEDHTLRNLTKNELVPRNILANSIGGGEEVFVEFRKLSPRILPGDVFLLCSDGFWEFWNEEEAVSLFQEENDIFRLGRSLFEPVEKISQDNITLLLFRIESENKE